ncbi:hypothetical protein D8674_024538 [Pyrus ussuriensis x Pyrus communis]|uniref:Uncharacterized protein n=1 Tax=Pyrus ussuriensis x Pyrus communis TaxID=2448454 RepID=A0A5N5H362_9ROSA|nr:hypothetical protein D8674_024538 [Pyrus ussuriensis x Pyrus communis]
MASTPLKIEGLLGMLTIRLQDINFGKWSFQFRSYFDGTNVCPPKYVLTLEHGITKEITDACRAWTKIDKALISLLIATLGDEVIKYIIGSKKDHEAWTNLCDRYATVSHARINHLKTELHTIKKGANIIEKYLLKLKYLKDPLLATRETISDNNLIVVALAESSNAGDNRQFYQGVSSNIGVNGQFYQGESSNQNGRSNSNNFNQSNGNNGGRNNQSNSNRNSRGFNGGFNGQGNKDHSNERNE